MKILMMDGELQALNLLSDTVQRLVPQAEIIRLRDPDEFQTLAQKENIRIAFFGIKLRDANGISLAVRLREQAPECNIIFVTAYPEYAVESFAARPSGFVCKPFTEEDIRRELADLRHPLPELISPEDKLHVVTFGAFKAYGRNGAMLNFTRTLSKEILAYLIDQSGFPVTSKDIASDVLEEPVFSERVSKRVSKLVNYLIEDLRNAGFPSVVIKQNRQLQINKDMVDCDLYKALEGDAEALESFRGEYMLEYSWAECNNPSGQLG